MKRLWRWFSLFCCAVALVGNASAQASRFVGTWTVDVQGSNRQRTAVIAQDGDTLRVAYGWNEPGAKLSLIEASLEQGTQLTMKTRSDSLIVVSLVDDNTMKGKFTGTSGKPVNVVFARTTGAPASAVATPPSIDATATPPVDRQAQPGPQSAPVAQIFADEAKDYGISPMKSPKGSPYSAATPLQIPGARTVTTGELKELMTKEPRPILIDALGAAEMIEAAAGMGGAIGEQRILGPERAGFPKALARLTGGDLQRPIVFYCRNSSCWHSYNASLHAVDAGYTNVLWYRGGIDAWRASGGRIVPVKRIADW